MSVLAERLDQTVGGKYRIVKFLAEGGMGSVYEAHHLVVKRRFAIKFLRSDLQRRRDVLARFKLEAEAAGALESENIAAALDFGIAADGAPYIVMEYLDGVDLGRLLSAHGPLPPARAADLVRQACSGAERAHEAGVLHRDLKPRNLLLCRRSDHTDLIKILDFGVAKLQAGEALHAVTRTGGMVGTPSYMSPEQARGDVDIDTRTDVYALGVILYELLSGRTPHPGESHNAVIHHIATQPPLPLAAAGYELPPELIAIVQRALQPEVKDRQASAAQLGDELSAFARREVWTPLLLDMGADARARDPARTSREAQPDPEPEVGGARSLQTPRSSLVAALVLGSLTLLAISWWATRGIVLESAAPLAPAAGRAEGVAPVAMEHALAPPADPSALVPAPGPTIPEGVSPDGRADAPRSSPGVPPQRLVPARPSHPRVRPRAPGAPRFDPQNPYD